MLVWSPLGGRAMLWVWCFSCGLGSELWAGDGGERTSFETHENRRARIETFLVGRPLPEREILLDPASLS